MIRNDKVINTSQRRLSLLWRIMVLFGTTLVARRQNRLFEWIFSLLITWKYLTHCGLVMPNTDIDLGWGLLSQFSPFRYFPNFSEWWKQWLPEWYQVHIWQVSPQLCCGDTWQIWTSLKVSNIYFCKIKIFRNGEINERSFSNPHPWFNIDPDNGLLHFALLKLLSVKIKCCSNWVDKDITASETLLTHCGLATPYGDIDLGQHWTLLPDDTEPLREPMFTVRNPLLLCPLVLAQDGGTRLRQKCLHRDFSATV